MHHGGVRTRRATSQPASSPLRVTMRMASSAGGMASRGGYLPGWGEGDWAQHAAHQRHKRPSHTHYSGPHSCASFISPHLLAAFLSDRRLSTPPIRGSSWR